MKINILTVLQYTTAGLLMVTGFCGNNLPLGFAGLGSLAATFGWDREIRRNQELKKMLDSLPDHNETAQAALKKASEFKELSTGEQGLIENGFIFGVEYTFNKITGSNKNK
jgi:hypothetical protein